jgi:aminoglycoside phosphotransferase (APT) family kinase protein
MRQHPLPPDAQLELLQGMSDPLAIAETTIAALRPELAGRPVTLLGAGWDSLAVLCDGLVFKLPKSPLAARSLEQEAAILRALRGKVRIAIPDMRLHPGPVSEHRVIPGQQLQAADYHRLTAAAKDRLAADLAGFHADLHRIDLARMRAAGATPVDPFPQPDLLATQLLPILSAALRPRAEAALADITALTDGPEPPVFLFNDGHGWNMAFDPTAQRLNGIYDFADSGIGDRHRDFVYAGFVSPDLTDRLITAYERETGLILNRARIRTLTQWHRMWELQGAIADGADMPDRIAELARYL